MREPPSFFPLVKDLLPQNTGEACQYSWNAPEEHRDLELNRLRNGQARWHRRHVKAPGLTGGDGPKQIVLSRMKETA